MSPPIYMIKFRAFIFSTVRHVYWIYIHRKINDTVVNILEVMFCLSMFIIVLIFDTCHGSQIRSGPHGPI